MCEGHSPAAHTRGVGKGERGGGGGGEREALQLEEEFGEDDFFEIYFIRSLPKSMTSGYENSFTVKTSGLLIRDVKNLDVLTLEFLPSNWEQCFFPSIEEAGHATWDVTGHLVMQSTFDASKYEQALYLGTMNGEVRASFLKWVIDLYVNKKQTFAPQSICNYKSATLTPDPDDDGVTCIVTQRNWDSFVEKCLLILSKYDVKISSVLPVKGKKIIVECSSLSDKFLYHSKLPSFYQNLYACMAGMLFNCSTGGSLCLFNTAIALPAADTATTAHILRLFLLFYY